MTLKELAEKILNYRIEHNMSQKEFAKRSGITNQTINRIENEKQTPTKLTVGKILKFIEKDG